MSQSNAQESLSRAVDLLGSARRKGIKLWSVNGQLHYKAPKGALSQEEIDKIRGSKRELIALLQKTVVTDDIEFTVRSDIRPEIVPLSFSQQAHWNEHRVYHLPDIRQIASATRLNGRLHIEVLRRSFDEMMRRHDALRTRIVHRDGVAVQQVGKLNDFVLELEDLTALPTQVQEKNVLRIIDELILQPIDVSVDLLFGARLIRLGQDEHVLIVVMEHMISDASSMGIFLHDLFAAYTQILRSEAVSLPDIPVQFADYAIWQQSTLNRFREKHESYWNERWAGCGRLRFPERKDIPAANRSGWECIPIHIDKDLKTELREWCRLRRTTMVMTIFAAYVGLVLRWCNAPKAVFVFQSDGRFSPKIEKAIGFFASALYLRIELHDEDTFVDLANQVAREYCQAYEHSDSCYMEAQLPRPEFTRNTVFNWVPQGAQIDLSKLDGTDDAITFAPVPFEHPMLKDHERDTEPVILLYDTAEEIVGTVNFGRRLLCADTMKQFGGNLMRFIKCLVRQPEQRVKDISLV